LEETDLRCPGFGLFFEKLICIKDLKFPTEDNYNSDPDNNDV